MLEENSLSTLNSERMSNFFTQNDRMTKKLNVAKSHGKPREVPQPKLFCLAAPWALALGLPERLHSQ